MDIIGRFRGDYAFLSNFSESPFEFEGFLYPTVEHAYQERKTMDPKRREEIRNASSPGEAARLGRSKDTVIVDGWFEGKKGEVMKILVTEKFLQNDDLMKKLIDTGNAILIEGNYWHDNYFGMCNCEICHKQGQPLNVLGNILMDIRSRPYYYRVNKGE